MIKNKMPARKSFGTEEFNAVKKMFEYYWKSGKDFGYQGHFEELYTDLFIKKIKTPGFADAVCTGTAALYISVASLQLKPGSKILVSPITDPGTLSAIILNNMVPVVIDAEPDSYNSGPDECLSRINKKVRAAMIVHAAGAPAPVNVISSLLKDKKIFLIEDCSQSHFARLADRYVGTFGEISAFSTMFSKTHSTGGCGGVVFTKNFERYKLIRAYADRGKSFFDKNFFEKKFSANYFPALNLNLNEISCAIGISSLNKIDKVILQRIKFLSKLDSALNSESRICSLINFSLDNSPFFQPVKIDTRFLKCSKIEFTNEITKYGITINPHYDGIVCEWPWVKPYLDDNFITRNAIKTRNNSFNLLFNENYGDKELNIIMDAINKAEKKWIK